MHLLPYLFIYFYTFSKHISPPCNHKLSHPEKGPIHYPNTNAKIPTQRFRRISEPGFLISIYQLIFPKLGITLFIQRLVFRVLTLVLRHDLLHLAHYLHVVETQGNA